jgi:hypothetical protein
VSKVQHVAVHLLEHYRTGSRQLAHSKQSLLQATCPKAVRMMYNMKVQQHCLQPWDHYPIPHRRLQRAPKCDNVTLVLAFSAAHRLDGLRLLIAGKAQVAIVRVGTCQRILLTLTPAHSTAQHSTAQHSTARHVVTQQETNASASC